ncbi:hypothetical protein [Mumia sp. Pv 4-285]|uniref:hypothetical protein n=1 Tax=Mumia qirimensis TaxID=3234852 RepID=UPI00351D43A3
MSRTHLAVVAKAAARLLLVDPQRGEVVRAVELSGTTGHEVAVDARSGLAYVPIYGDAVVGGPGRDGRTIDVVDLRVGERVATLTLPRGSRPHAAVANPDGSLYVTAEGLAAVLHVDSDGTVRRRLGTGNRQSHMLVVDAARSHAYTCDVDPGSITALDLSTGRRTVLPLGTVANRISLSPDESHVFVADQQQPRLVVVEVPSLRVARWVDLPSVGFATAALGDGRLLVGLRETSKVVVVDPWTGRAAEAVEVPDMPEAVVLDPDGERAYVTCSGGEVVLVLGLDPLRELGTVDCPGGPDGLATYEG